MIPDCLRLSPDHTDNHRLSQKTIPMSYPTLRYDIPLPNKVEEILEVDFWVFTHLSATHVRAVREAVKFTSLTSVYVAKGSAEIDINLRKVRVNSPCVVLIRPSEVVQIHQVTDDFDASFIVLNTQMRDSLMMAIHDAGIHPGMRMKVVAEIDRSYTAAYAAFYDTLEAIASDTDNKYRNHALLHAMLSFYFTKGHRSYTDDTLDEAHGSSYGHKRNLMVDRFLILAQENFRTQRLTEFYAGQLGVSAKHLSRMLKQLTGYTASEWIKNYVVLEAKVMLKSSTMSMREIADRLNFPSQSFFAKFFKNATGLTPKQYRNKVE